MSNRLRAFVGATLCACAVPAFAGDLVVMTRNQYLGGDIGPLIATAGTPDFDAAVVAALQQIAASRTPERMAALAAEIRERSPALVGVQEMWKFECEAFPGVPPMPDMGCDDPTIRDAFGDQRVLTEAALAGAYVVAAQVTNLDIRQAQLPNGMVVNGLPFLVNGVPALLRATDRDAILVRSDVAPTATPVNFGCEAEFVSDQGCNFAFALTLPAVGRVERGFVGVDVTIDGVPYRFVNTHLEIRDAPVPPEPQALQMSELLGRVLATPSSKHLVLVGDFNSDPTEPAGLLPTPYWQATGVGLLNAWELRPGDVAGYTCCHAADLRNLPSRLSQRIDHVWVREMPSRIGKVRVVGGTANYRLPPAGRGLWPSDHAGVVAAFGFE